MDNTLFLNQMGCPDSEVLGLFINNRLPEKLDLEIESHVEHCLACKAYLESTCRREPGLFDLREGLKSKELGALYRKPEILGYEILDFYKAGGQGVIFKARETTLDRLVAIKVLKTDYISESNRENAIISEAQAIARISHPNIVKLHSLAWTPQGPAMVMDWVDGSSLMDWLGEHKCSHKDAARLLVKMCDAVAMAHEAGILHRDIKPSNILLKNSDLNVPMLCDFGLAKLQRADGHYSTATIGVGTAGYMAPEMISSRFGKISAQSDIYSLGALLYQLLTGRLPHESNSAYETMERTCEKDVMRPSTFENGIHRDLETICLKCMQRDPALRYVSVNSLKADLENHLKNQPVSARRSNPFQKLKIWSREHPWVATLAVALFGVMFTSLLVLSYALNRAIEGERRTEQELARTAEILRLSAPLVKSYLQLGILKTDEARRIEKLSHLFKEIGTGSPSTRQSFDLIYVGLELAGELKNLKGQHHLALEMTRQGRIDLNQLISERHKELDEQAFLIHEGKIAISLLDQAMVRYGHSCIQEALILKSQGLDPELTKSESLINQALQSVQAVIQKNPEVDEAYTDQANYLAFKSTLLKSRGDFKAAAELAVKIESIHEKMLRQYPDAPEKINFWLLSVQELIRSLQDFDVESFDIQPILRHVQEEMKRVRNQNETVWKLTAEAFSNVFLLNARNDFGRGRTTETLTVLDETIQIWREMTLSKSPLPIHLKTYLGVGIEMIAALQANESKKNEALTLFHELERFLQDRSDDGFNRELLAELYLRSPIDRPQTVQKANELLATIELEHNQPQLLNTLCKLYENPNVQVNASVLQIAPEYQNRYDVMQIESYLNHKMHQQAKNILIASGSRLNRLPNVTIDDQIRLTVIRKQLGEAQ